MISLKVFDKNVTSKSSDYKLIEALGEGIVDHLKSKFGIKKVKLRLSKPGALRFSKDVGIMIER